MLTWGVFNIIGGTEQNRNRLIKEQEELVLNLNSEIDRLGIESDGAGWKAKTFLYCIETKCPQSGWMVPLLPTFIISRGNNTIVELVPDSINKRYDIIVCGNVSESEIITAKQGTVRSDGRGKDPYLIHSVDGVEYRTKISTLRGDYRKEDGSSGNRLRFWEKLDFKPRPDDIFQERLYCIQWMRPKEGKKTFDYSFRAVTEEDLKREKDVEDFLSLNINDWQNNGWIPDMKIETGYNTRQPIWERGWTYWHQLFNPRQLLVNGLINRFSNSAALKFGVNQAANWNSKLSSWDGSPGVNTTHQTFYNQALNTLLNYGVRSSQSIIRPVIPEYKRFPFPNINAVVESTPADKLTTVNDIYITDPPYGDAVKYEEILEFFIAWLRKNPPVEFANWTWDSRRGLAIKGEDEGFRRGMVAAYKRMTEMMPDNGIQVIMFTHQSGTIWADMANIVWASGLHVSAAWYVVTETDTLPREGSYVKGTVFLVLRKRQGSYKTSRGDLAWEIQEEVEEQVKTLTGLNQNSKDLYRDENIFSDADLQMAGYAAALRVLTKYSIIDGKDMETEAVRPRVKKQLTFVDDLIEFAVGVANQCLVPPGIEKSHWDNLQPAERFYLKMLDLEAKGSKTLDNYQNFSKAFQVRSYKPFMASEKANAARLKSSEEFGKTDMSGDSEFANTVLRGVLYGIWELQKDIEGDKVVSHLGENIPDYYRQRDIIVELADYLAKKLEGMRPEEASSARVLRDLVRNQKMG